MSFLFHKSSSPSAAAPSDKDKAIEGGDPNSTEELGDELVRRAGRAMAEAGVRQAQEHVDGLDQPAAGR
jgi:hypothetical protein